MKRSPPLCRHVRRRRDRAGQRHFARHPRFRVSGIAGRHHAIHARRSERLHARPRRPGPRRGHGARTRADRGQERHPPRRRRRDRRSISNHPGGEPPGPRQGTIGWPRRPVARPAGAHRCAHPVDGGGPAPDRGAAGPRRRDRRDADAALRPSGGADAGAAGGDRDHLRVTAQRHRRRRRAVPEVRQRDHPQRRLRSAGVEPRDCRVHPRGAGGGGTAPRRGAGGRDQQSRRGRDAHRHGFACGRHRAEGRQGAHRAHRP